MTTTGGGQRATVPVSAVDAHMHVLRRDAPLVAERHSKPARDATVDELIGVLDGHGVSHALLTAPSFYGADNSLLLEALDAYPLRLRGTVILHPDTEARALARLARRGVVGVRFNWIRREQLPDLAAADYAAFLDRVRALGWHVELYLEGEKMPRVLPRLRDAGVTVVVDHFGSPDPAEGVRSAGFAEVLRGVRAGDTFVKLSAPYRLGGADPRPYVDALLDAGGPAQLMWASDWPFVGHESTVRYRECVDDLAAWIPDPETRRVVRVDTPVRLFRFDRPRGDSAHESMEEGA
jgi:predicted TIM-barrel fold metal-dependent hydrolase